MVRWTSGVIVDVPLLFSLGNLSAQVGSPRLHRLVDHLLLAGVMDAILGSPVIKSLSDAVGVPISTVGMREARGSLRPSVDGGQVWVGGTRTRDRGIMSPAE